MSGENNSELRLDIKKLIIETLNIPNVKPEEVDDEEPLFGGNNILTLDSVDAIEIIMAVQRKYSVRINDQNLARTVVRSIKDIADFITRERAESQ